MAKKCMSCGGSMNKMQKGGTTSSPKLERLSAKVAKKTAAGKPVSKSLTKRYDKAVDKVITSGMKKMQDGGPTVIQSMRRNMLTNRSNRLDARGNENLAAGNKEKANKQFQKSDDLLAKRRELREKAGYKNGGSTSFGMISVKAGVDNNPKPTAADRIAGAKKKMAKGGMMKTTVGGPAKKPFAAGIPYYTGAGQTGPESMSIGGAIKKANEIRKGALKIRKVARIVDKVQNLKKAKSGTKAMTNVAKAASPISTLKNILYKKYKK